MVGTKYSYSTWEEIIRGGIDDNRVEDDKLNGSIDGNRVEDVEPNGGPDMRVYEWENSEIDHR